MPEQISCAVRSPALAAAKDPVRTDAVEARYAHTLAPDVAPSPRPAGSSACSPT
jgi:hypothetical protein